jgi:LuxR family maltose regulon positive regulatory protein
VDFPHAMPPPDPAMLTPREREVLQLLAMQMSTTKIAAAMSISVNTVRTRVRRALRKLGATGRDEAAQQARNLGLV